MRWVRLDKGFSANLLRMWLLMVVVGVTLSLNVRSFAQQADQGAITGTVFDPGGSVVANATVTIQEMDTAYKVVSKTNGSGVYVATPLNIGRYSVTCEAPGFKTISQVGLMLNVDSRLDVNCHLEVGEVSQKVTVQASDEPLLQTEESSTGQVMTSKVVNETPLNGRNYVFIAQLAAGVVQSNGSRGQGGGDFNANGARAEENNFILDGVNNNTTIADFLNGASFVIKPPPDALAEFRVQTGNYSAELGHSAGAVINASIKAGTNAFHGDLWEYLRNDALNANSFGAATIPEYRQNQFGATIGGPILKNRLFFFGDTEATRIVFGQTSTLSVPTLLMRQGNFSELLNPTLSGSQAVTLYQPGSGGATHLSCQGQPNVFCPDQLNATAQHLINLWPLPNANNGKTYSNYRVNVNEVDNTITWDGRLDWNVSARDQAFARMSNSNEARSEPPPLGILDGGGYGTSGSQRLRAEAFVLGETHMLTPTLVNQFRFSVLYGNDAFLQANADTDVSAELGLGGIPFSPNFGGLPYFAITGLSQSGTIYSVPAFRNQNTYSLLDNVSKTIGNHSVRVGLELMQLRSAYYGNGYPRGNPTYTGLYTSLPGRSFTGYGVADFMSDEQASNALQTAQKFHWVRWYRSAFIQDDWKLSPRLTFNLGLRYDYAQPLTENNNAQANFYITSTGVGVGAAQMIRPVHALEPTLPSAFLNLANQNNVAIVSSQNRGLANAQKTNFAPRIGFAYSPTSTLVVRGAYGIFFGGLENVGGVDLAVNYPYSWTAHFTAPSCIAAHPCVNDGITLANGFGSDINFANLPLTLPNASGSDLNIKTTYTNSYNLTIQRSVGNDMTATVGYVGSTSRHLVDNLNFNASAGLAGAGVNTQQYQPLPGFSAVSQLAYNGASNYNSLQASLERRFSKGLYFFGSYTYAHALDDSSNPLDGDTAYQNNILLPIGYNYGNSKFDVRQRVTLNGNYQLPFGVGRAFLSHAGLLNEIAGGWAVGVVFVAQTGNPFTISPNITTATGGTPRAVLTGDPSRAGGSPNATNPGITCPAKVRTRTNWYNPCALSNPLPGSSIAPGSLVTSTALAAEYLGTGKNQVYGPGYNRLNTSVFKRFATFEGQYLEFRADVFNTYNSPAYGQPSASLNSSGGLITGTRSLGNNSPDGRFIQVALKYVF